jgi:hypothetical protein
VLETMRTLFVWIGGLALFYSSGTGKIGERWDNYSYFQVRLCTDCPLGWSAMTTVVDRLNISMAYEQA